MFAVLGWDNTFKRHEPLLKSHCHRCNGDVSWRIWHETVWVSLFFVRLIPLFTKYHIACDACRDSLPIASDTCRTARNRQVLDARASRELHDELVKRIENHQYGGMTEGQRTYYKRTREQRNENV